MKMKNKTSHFEERYKAVCTHI